MYDGHGLFDLENSNIILGIEMSIVNLKTIFVKKQKADTRTFISRPGREIHL